MGALHSWNFGRMCCSNRIVQTVLGMSKLIIEYLARGVEFAAALIIVLAAAEATVKALVLFFLAKRYAGTEDRGANDPWPLACRCS